MAVGVIIGNTTFLYIGPLFEFCSWVGGGLCDAPSRVLGPRGTRTNKARLGAGATLLALVGRFNFIIKSNPIDMELWWCPLGHSGFLFLGHINLRLFPRHTYWIFCLRSVTWSYVRAWMCALLMLCSKVVSLISLEDLHMSFKYKSGGT